MRRPALYGLAACLVVLVAGMVRAEGGGASKAPDVVRGKYLVTRVGLCQDCHSPRGADGRFIADEWLQGQILPFKPTAPMPAWAEVAPAIAGLVGYTDEQALKALTQGVGVTGQPFRPPMPAYRLNDRDARDVIAYLRAVTPPEDIPTTTP